MSGPDAGGQPDLDEVLAAVVELLAAATYVDAVRHADVVAITRGVYAAGDVDGDRDPAASMDLRRQAVAAEHAARTALYGLLDHERAMRLIPLVSAARYPTAVRGEEAYAALTELCPACGRPPTGADPLVRTSGGARVHWSHVVDPASGFYDPPVSS